MAQLAFKYVDVLTTPDDTKYIHWQMDRYFSTLVRFYVDWARSGSDWTCLNPDDPVYNSCVYQDAVKRTWNMEKNIYYRVRAQDRHGAIYTSLPRQALGSLSKEDYLMAKEIARINYVALKKRGGMHGFLLKRKEWGAKCVKCTDFDVEEVINGKCDICYGTGIAGGYFEGIDYWINSQPVMRDRKLNPQGTGEMNPQQRTVYGIAYPWIDSGDIWVSGRANDRYVIRQIKHMAEMGETPVLLNMVMHRLPETSVAMQIPVAAKSETFVNEWAECPSGTSSLAVNPVEENSEIVKSGSATEEKWRRGLEDSNW